MTGKIRKARIEETGKIMQIIEEAKASLKNSGIDQWQDGYPLEETIQKDIQTGISYLLETETGEIGATAAISDRKEPDYEKIYQGKWLSLQPYVVIHRIAVGEQFKRCGYGAELLSYAEHMAVELGIGDIKIDTHQNNQPMQQLLKTQGFARCGIIYLRNGSKRIAYEKILTGNI